MFQKNKRKNIKEKCLIYLGGKICATCKVDSLPYPCYDFHHIKGNKKDNISKMIPQGISWETLKKELDKCIVLCKNCHAYAHHFNQKFYIKDGVVNVHR